MPMENIGRRGLLTMFFAAGTVAALGAVASRAEAALGAADIGAGAAASDAASAVEAVEVGMEPTQAIVIRPGARRGRRVIVRPRRRPWRRRRVCVRRRGRLVCTWR